MARTLHRALALLVLLALALAPALAGMEDDAGTETVRLYTNADLLKYGPPSSEPGETIPQQDLGWDFVLDFLEREAERLDADREHEREQRRLDHEEEAIRRHHERHERARVPLWLFPHAHRFGGFGTAPHVRTETPRPAHALGRAAPTRDIVPLHARPTPGMAHRARVIRQHAAGAGSSE